MPYTPDFNKLRRRLREQYNDKAKAETFAFKTAFKENIKTWEDRKPKFKKRGKKLEI